MHRRGLDILVVDDEVDYCNAMKVILSAKGHHPDTCNSGVEALKRMKDKNYDLVLTDLIMPYMDGSQLLNEIKKSYPNTEVIMMTAYGSIENAVGSMREGAYSYITKGGNPAELICEIEKLQSMLELKRENELLKEKIRHDGGMLESKNPLFLDMLSIAKKAAESDINILILGESGVGKEIMARFIHDYSLRKKQRFVDLNCHALASNVLESELFGHEKGSFTGAISRRIGLIESANQGTLFLDEIGDMPLSMQAKLLKTIENKRIYRMGSNDEIEVDFRLISATNKNLEAEILAGGFREDFFYRISTVALQIPALRHRPEDLPLLIDYFFRKSQKELNKEIREIKESVMTFLLNYTYPGNVRELKNIIERLVVLSEDGVVNERGLPGPVINRGPEMKHEAALELKPVRQQAEKEHIQEVLKIYNYNKTLTAEALGITRRQLFNKITEYRLEE